MRCAFIAILALVLSAPAAAEDYPPTLDKRLIALVTPADGALKCWKAKGDDLAVDTFSFATGKYRLDRPVKSMVFAVKVSTWPDAKAGWMYTFGLLTRFKEDAGRYASVGECGYAYSEGPPDYAAAGGWITCSIECDGGHVDLRSVSAGIEVRLSRGQHLTMAGCGGGGSDGGDEAYQQKGSDRIFTFAPASPRACKEAGKEAFGE